MINCHTRHSLRLFGHPFVATVPHRFSERFMCLTSIRCLFKQPGLQKIQ